jgi:predicted DNA-binding protein (MmcQ/YjbR family)
MNVESIREYCLSKPEVTESLPFGDDTVVFKVLNKMFVLMNLDGELSVNLKCDPDKAFELREIHSSVRPGYHMNKKYWNTVMVDDSVSDELLKEWIDHSYAEVVKGLPKVKQKILGYEKS